MSKHPDIRTPHAASRAILPAPPSGRGHSALAHAATRAISPASPSGRAHPAPAHTASRVISAAPPSGRGHSALARAARRAVFTTVAAALATFLTSCATLSVPPLPDPIRPAKADAADQAEAPEVAEEAAPEFRVSRPPGVVVQEAVAEGIADRLGQGLTGDPIALSFHDIPLVAFINEVFGHQLGMSFAIDPALQGKTDLVTLRLMEPIPPSQLFSTARRVLQSYGVDIQEEDGILNFVARDDIASREIPLLVSGESLPEVPASHRTIFQLVPLRVAGGNFIQDWLRQTFDSDDLEARVETRQNAIILRGRREMIERALALIEVFDQPYLRGRYGAIFEPVFTPVGELASALRDVLTAEGYAASVGGTGGSITLVPLEGLNKILVFAADNEGLAHVEDWARSLDTRRQEAIEEATFTYQVRNTAAESLTETLNAVLALQSGEGTVTQTANQSISDAFDAQDGSRRNPGGRIVADPNRNVLLFHGSGKEWAAILEVIRELDQPVPSVLIEVLIAEITLTNDEGAGFEFSFDGMLDRYGISGGTLGALGIKAKGLSLRGFNNLGETRAALNFFFEESRVAIRSRPRLMVKSGESANIDVGNEIPVISAIADTGVQTGGSTNVLQQVTYRKTGVQLEITPIVQANGLVDLEISQQFSEARPGAGTSIDGSPTILNRQLSTTLTLKDGGSVLMGGLISNNQNDGRGGVPVVGRLPWIGRLFSSQNLLTDRTELAVLVIPYVVADHQEGQTLTNTIRQNLDLHQQLTTPTP